VLASALVIVAACGSSPNRQVARLSTNAAAPSAHENGWLAFASCMRSSGVSSYPDPASNGPPPKESLEQLGVSSSRFEAAQSACRHLLPNGGRPPSRAEEQQVTAEALRFSECVRSHGVPDFPDPGSDGRIPDPATVGVDQGSPKFQAANQACRAYRPPYMPSNAAYNTYARSHGS